ncbi:RHS repeat-associated core domain-containing protein [Sinomonas atrocyanea]
MTLTDTVTDQVSLTATASQAIDYLGLWIYIFDLNSSPHLLKYCTSGSTCSITTVPSEGQANYQAFLAQAGVTSFPTSPAASSATVAPPAWNVALTPNVGSTIGLTATTNYNIGNASTAWNYYIQIFDSANTSTSGTTYLAFCSSGTTCSTSTVPHLSNSSYVAFVGSSPSNTYPMNNPLATSNPFRPAPWTVTLTQSGSNLTATTNYDPANSGLYVEIFDLTATSSTTYVGWCSSGTSCTKTTGSPGHTFIAAVGTLTNTFPMNSTLATSNQTGGGSGPTAAFETRGGANPSEANMCFACSHDPINTSNGEFFENYTDLSVKGRGPGLALGRGYSAQSAQYDSSFGYGWTFSYDMHLSQPSTGAADITQENGSVDHFTQNTSGAWVAPAQVNAQLAQNPDGTWTFTRRGREIFDFDSSGKLLRVRDLNGYATTVARDSQGRVASITDPAGRSITFAYDANNHITSATDPAGRKVVYGYDGNGRLTAVTDPAGNPTGYGYGPFNLLTTVTDANNKTMTNAYDAANRVISQTDRNGNKTTFAYSSDGTNNTTTTTSPGGRVTAETYNAGQRVSVTHGSGTPQAATWSYQYDPSTFALTKTTDPLNHVTTATYDQYGNRTSSTDANNHTSSWTYNALNEILTATDPLGTTTTYTYDTAGNPLTASTPLTGTAQTATTTYTYGDAAHPGDVTAVTDPDGRKSTFAYDAAGNRLTATDPLGNTTTYTYDAIGRALTAKTPRGNTTSYTYDAGSRLITVADPLGHTTTYGYDPTGLRTTVTDANNHTTTTAYDPDGHPIQVTHPDSTTATTAYDVDGNTASTTDANGKTTAYVYDPLDRVTSSTDPLNRATTYAYDAAGHLTGTTNAAGKTATITYDPAGNKTGTTYSDGTTHAEAFTYTAANQQATMADTTGTTTSTYDSLGRLTAQTNGNTQTVGYTYDLAGQLTAIAYPNGQSVTRTYDTAGHLTAITDWAGHTTTFTPDADGNTATTAYANGVTASASYDATDAMSGITDTGPGNIALASFAYTRNPVNNLTSMTVTGITAPSETYTYSAKDQITGVNTGAYSYDSAGNPTALATGAALAYDAASQPTTYTLSGTTTNLTYDSQGNRTTGPGPNSTTATYTWDQANRLNNANGATATYNAVGLRATRTPAGASTQHYAWDLHGSVPLMLTDGATSYLYDDAGNPVEQFDSTGTVMYYQHDQYGSTRTLTDATGAPAATFTYDAYGNLTAKAGTADTVLRWNGQAQDPDTGIYYLRARYYDPQTAQFTSVDPMVGATRDPFGYASANPLNSSDPIGLWSLSYCINVSAGAFFGVGRQDCFAAAIDDRNGKFTLGTTETLNKGIEIPGGVGISVSQTVTTARSVDQLAGVSGYGGLSANWEGAHAGINLVGGQCNDALIAGGILGVDSSVGLAAETPIAFHAGVSTTTTNTLVKRDHWWWW